MGENGAGFLGWGLGEGVPVEFPRMGDRPPSWEAGVLGPWPGSATDSQCDLASISPNVHRWHEHPRILTRGRRGRREGEDTATSGPGAPQTWAPLRPVPGVEPPQLFVPHSVPLKWASRGCREEVRRCHLQPAPCPARALLPICRKREQYLLTVDCGSQERKLTKHPTRGLAHRWYKGVCLFSNC